MRNRWNDHDIPRGRPDPYGIWSEGATTTGKLGWMILCAGLAILLTGAVGFVVGWGFGVVMRGVGV